MEAGTGTLGDRGASRQEKGFPVPHLPPHPRPIGSSGLRPSCTPRGGKKRKSSTLQGGNHTGSCLEVFFRQEAGKEGAGRPPRSGEAPRPWADRLVFKVIL